MNSQALINLAESLVQPIPQGMLPLDEEEVFRDANELKKWYIR